MARRIGDIVPFIGGLEHATALIPILEHLCGVEETTVRMAASTSTCKVLKKLAGSGQDAAIDAFLQMFKKLSNPETAEIFYPRASAVHICPELLHCLKSSDDVTALMQTFTELSRDEILIVRRAAATVAPRLAGFSASSLMVEICHIHKQLCADESSAVQVTAINNTAAMARVFQEKGSTEALAELVPLIKAESEDHSWCIRTAVAQNFGDFADVFSEHDLSAEVFPALGTLLMDPESDIRVLACNAASRFITKVGTAAYLSEIVPIAQQLADDETPGVRKSLTDLVVDSALKLGHEASAPHLYPLISRFVGDADAMVRIRVVQKLPQIAELLPQLFTKLTGALVGLFNDGNWRVRKGMLSALPSVVKNLGVEYFQEQFLSHYLAGLKDGVSETREEAAAVLPTICNVAHSTSDWVHEKIFPTLKAMAKEECLLRVTMLAALLALMRAENITPGFMQEILELVIASTKDSVANIRLRAMKIINEIGKKQPITAEQSSQLRGILNDLSVSDRDKDVKYFAAEALSSFQA
jgi:serine/threonine-protein phosphatase 2A regulatory subunit A